MYLFDTSCSFYIDGSFPATWMFEVWIFYHQFVKDSIALLEMRNYGKWHVKGNQNSRIRMLSTIFIFTFRVWSSCVLDSNYSCYRDMFLTRPRARIDGCYISKITYIRPGEHSFQDQSYRLEIIKQFCTIQNGYYLKYLIYFVDLGILWNIFGTYASFQMGQFTS